MGIKEYIDTKLYDVSEEIANYFALIENDKPSDTSTEGLRAVAVSSDSIIQRFTVILNQCYESQGLDINVNIIQIGAINEAFTILSSELSDSGVDMLLTLISGITITNQTTQQTTINIKGLSEFYVFLKKIANCFKYSLKENSELLFSEISFSNSTSILEIVQALMKKRTSETSNEVEATINKKTNALKIALATTSNIFSEYKSFSEKYLKDYYKTKFKYNYDKYTTILNNHYENVSKRDDLNKILNRYLPEREGRPRNQSSASEEELASEKAYDKIVDLESKIAEIQSNKGIKERRKNTLIEKLRAKAQNMRGQLQRKLRPVREQASAFKNVIVSTIERVKQSLQSLLPRPSAQVVPMETSGGGGLVSYRKPNRTQKVHHKMIHKSRKALQISDSKNKSRVHKKRVKHHHTFKRNDMIF